MSIELLEPIEVMDRAEISGGTVLVKYSKTESELSALRAKHEGVVFDLTTTKGDKEARSARLELVTLRTSLEKKRKEFKAPALDLGGKIDSEAKRITAEILVLETFIDQQIKADEKRRDDEKAERERIEALRVQGIQDKIATIRGFVAKCQGIRAERISKGIELLEKIDTGSGVFFEFECQAVAAQAETLQAMRDMHAAAVKHETELSRIEAQRIENERIAEQHRIQAKAMAAQQAEIDRAAAAIKAEQDRLEAEKIRITEAERERSAKVEYERIQREQAEAVQQERIRSELDHATIPAQDIFHIDDAAILTDFAERWPHVNAEADAEEAAQASSGPTINLGQIRSRLGIDGEDLGVTARLLSALGFEPCATDKAAKLYRESQFLLICKELVKHIQSVAE